MLIFIANYLRPHAEDRVYGRVVKGSSSEPEGPGSSPVTTDFLAIIAPNKLLIPVGKVY